MGQARSFALLPAGRDLGDTAQVNLTAQIAGAALRPMAPVHPRARREAAGVRFSFIRQTRLGGDNWEAFEVPLGEASEAYRFEILDGVAIKRTIDLGTPGYLYSVADELADFGSPRASIRIRARQISAVMGPAPRSKPTF